MVRLTILTISAFLVLSGCASKEEQHAQHVHAQSAVIEQSDTYTCPMHPQVTGGSPGTCPTCGMDLVKKEASEIAPPTATTPVAQIREARKLLADAKRSLAREGRYECCIETPCNECAIDHQSCPCYHNLKAGKPVCPECYGGWRRGEGRDRSIQPSSVKTEFSGHRH